MDRPTERPTFHAFLSQLARLTNDEAREIAEVERVTDWRRDSDWSTLLDQEFVGQDWGDRRRHALAAARRCLDDDAFWQLAGGWYAVIEGRWRRGKRSYVAWTWLLASALGLMIRWVILEITGVGKTT